MIRTKFAVAAMFFALAAACVPHDQPRYTEAPKPADAQLVAYPPVAASAQDGAVYEYH